MYIHTHRAIVPTEKELKMLDAIIGILLVTGPVLGLWLIIKIAELTTDLVFFVLDALERRA